jgi:UDP-N-acetylmuramoyl-L-alanyl-D-glutamate--2,6-diaminopimelate ligase
MKHALEEKRDGGSLEFKDMKWNEAMAGVGVVATAGSADADICGVQYDSRHVGVGDVFVAMRGGTTDGNKFVDAALSKGAAAVVTDSEETFVWLHKERPELAIALVEHGRRALAEVSAAVFGHPEKKLKLSAVTKRPRRCCWNRC